MEVPPASRQLSELIAEEIAAQLGVQRRAEDMPTLIADAILDVFRIESLVQEPTAAADLAASIRLGCDAVSSDPNLDFSTPEQDELDWLGAWLHSEGWRRSGSWAAHDR